MITTVLTTETHVWPPGAVAVLRALDVCLAPINVDHGGASTRCCATVRPKLRCTRVHKWWQSSQAELGPKKAGRARAR
jgi:hypothetical protein